MNTTSFKNTFAEAILEFRWGSPPKLDKINQLPSLDYKIFLTNIYRNIQKEYPTIKILNNAKVPEELAYGLVQYQFRKKEDEFPLVQAGPGVFTINENNIDSLSTFKTTATKEIEHLYKSYPDISAFNKFRLVLKFIYGKEFNYKTENITEYINTQTNLKIDLDEKVLEANGIEKKFNAIEAKLSLPSTNPVGDVIIIVGKGKKRDKDAIIWDISIESKFENLTNPQNEIEKWINLAEKQIINLAEGLVK